MGVALKRGMCGYLTWDRQKGHDRCGELVVKAADGITHTFKIHVTHRFPIPEDTYTLLGDHLYRFWAVGRRMPDQRFEKVSVIVIDFKDRYKLEDLSLVARSHNVLV